MIRFRHPTLAVFDLVLGIRKGADTDVLRAMRNSCFGFILLDLKTRFVFPAVSTRPTVRLCHHFWEAYG